MLTGFHSVVVDVADFDAAVRDYALLLGCAPADAARDPAHGMRSARFSLSNAQLELRGLGAGAERTAPSPGLPVRGEEGIAGLRFAFRPAPGSRFLPGWLAGPTVPIELVAEVAEPPAGSSGPSATVEGLDHVVVVSPDPERTRRYFAEELGIRLALDRSFAERGLRLIFFRLGGVTLEVASALAATPVGSRRDTFQGLAWKVTRIEAIQTRLLDAGFDVSEIRMGHKTGTRVATVRGPVHGVPTLLIEHPPRDAGAREA